MRGVPGLAKIWKGVFLKEKQNLSALMTEFEVIESDTSHYRTFEKSQRYISIHVLVETLIFDVTLTLKGSTKSIDSTESTNLLTQAILLVDATDCTNFTDCSNA